MITLFSKLSSDSFAYSGMHPENKSDELSAIIADAVSFRNDLIARVNNPDGKDNPKIVKAYYKTVAKDLITGVDKLLTGSALYLNPRRKIKFL